MTYLEKEYFHKFDQSTLIIKICPVIAIIASPFIYACRKCLVLLYSKALRVRVYSFKPIPFSVAFFFGICILLSCSSENGRFGTSPKPSTARNGSGLRDFQEI